VHLEAAAWLAQLGTPALPELLKALTNPELAASPRMREGAYHVLYYNSAPEVRNYASHLLEALKAALPTSRLWLRRIVGCKRSRWRILLHT